MGDCEKCWQLRNYESKLLIALWQMQNPMFLGLIFMIPRIGANFSLDFAAIQSFLCVPQLYGSAT